MHPIGPVAIVRPIRASLSENPTAPVSVSKPGQSKLPLKDIPGDYGLPFVGPIKDRLDYFYNQGRDEFFRSKIQKYQSTVFRTNMPPGPFISSDPKVVALLDGKSFPVLSMCPKLRKKTFSRASKVIPEFEACYSKLYETLEKELSEKGKSSFQTVNDQAGFNFLCRAFFGSNPPDTKLGDDGPGLISKWVLLQLGPVLSLGLPGYVEELAIRTFPLPPFLVKKDYQRLYDFFYQSFRFRSR
ncbi:hypothetical protein V6N11_017953 [Hibiscus sabdariffa]|uniref:Allene oxide synthase n=1 Tax=Hibiscus sabdariffa TaxID=183260 RepID=A0ABR2T5Z6_9ROSI